MLVPRRLAFQVALERLHPDACALTDAERVDAAAARSRSLASQFVQVDLAAELISRDSDTVPGELVAIVKPTAAELGESLLNGGRVPDFGKQSAGVVGVGCNAHVILENVSRGPLGNGEHIDLNRDLLAIRVISGTLGVQSKALLHQQPCQ